MTTMVLGLSKNECICDDKSDGNTGLKSQSLTPVFFYKFAIILTATSTSVNGLSGNRSELSSSSSQYIASSSVDPIKNHTISNGFSGDEDAHIIIPEWRLQKVQSPIELTHNESNEYDHFEPLEFHGHWDKGGRATFTNNGYTATLRFYDRELPLLIGGPLHHDEYIFEQLHFHWSENDHSGCEHIFEGKAYSMETHVVHYNKKYKNFNEAHDKHDGLAVVAFFINATDNDEHPCFNKITEGVKKIQKINTSTDVASDCLTWMTEAAKCKGYYTYQGSLTTEPYTESVTWILYPTPIHVSRQQVAHFREMKSTPCETVNILNNVRPLQTPSESQKLDIIYARSHRKSE